VPSLQGWHLLYKEYMETKNLDVVYVLKCGRFEECDELRYSLRSLENLPHRNVHIFGDKPDWVRNVTFHDITQVGEKWENVNRLLSCICHTGSVTDDFILMNDDFYIMSAVEELPYYGDGTLMDRYNQIAKDWEVESLYQLGLKQASETLSEAHKDTYNFELHVPIILNKEKLLPIVEQYPMSCARRSLYCNFYNIKPVPHKDVKIYDPDTRDFPVDFLSSNDSKFSGSLREYVDSRFPDKCIYEE